MSKMRIRYPDTAYLPLYILIGLVLGLKACNKIRREIYEGLGY